MINGDVNGVMVDFRKGRKIMEKMRARQRHVEMVRVDGGEVEW